MQETEPRLHQRLGRQVHGFEPALWRDFREEIVFVGNVLKFSQNDDLWALLQATGSKLLVGASPTDLIWGIGLDENNPLRLDEKNWKGLNLLGHALTRAREYIKAGKSPEAASQSLKERMAARRHE